MASNFESSIRGGSDLFYDFSCFTCHENDLNTKAEFYCEKCSKLFCGKCVELHNTLFKKHATLGEDNISQWPETDVDKFELCQEHKKEKLTGFCEDHNELICHVCHIYNHQKCTHVVLIADKVKDLHQTGFFQLLSATVDEQHQQLIYKKDDLDENMKSLEKSYKNILKEINAFRRAINDSLDLLEKNTKKELDTLLATMRKSIQTDIENCIKSTKNIISLKDDWLRRKDKSEVLSYIKYRKCLHQSLKVEAVLQEMFTKNEENLTFNPDTTIQQTLSTLSGLGQILSQVKQSQPAKRNTQNTRQNKSTGSSQSDPGNQKTQGFRVKKSNPKIMSSRQYNPGNQTSDLNKLGQISDPVSSSSYQQLVPGYQPGAVNKPDFIIKVKSSQKYSVKIESDSKECSISGISETAAGELIITDRSNNTVKLLDQTYMVVATYDLPYTPVSMCSIDCSQIAVALNNSEIHFIRVTNGQLVKDRILKLQHQCLGIAHHQGNMYMTDGEVLYNHTMDGRPVSKMYEEGSSRLTVCAVSPDGDGIYVTNRNSNQLVTLSRNGTVISTFTDSALHLTWIVPPGLHVTDSGKVLVCGGLGSTIFQLDKDGRHILAEVVTSDDGVIYPISVYYSKLTGSLIVGLLKSDDITVFKAQ